MSRLRGRAYQHHHVHMETRVELNSVKVHDEWPARPALPVRIMRLSKTPAVAAHCRASSRRSSSKYYRLRSLLRSADKECIIRWPSSLSRLSRSLGPHNQVLYFQRRVMHDVTNSTAETKKRHQTLEQLTERNMFYMRGALDRFWRPPASWFSRRGKRRRFPSA